MQQYLRFIDGLRAIAVISVVAFHAGLPWVSGGFVGVDVFFVISGYLITGLLLDDLKQHDRIRFAIFFARRVRRLMPAMMLVLLSTAIAGAFLILPDEAASFRKSIHAVIMFYANLHFMQQVGGYFAPLADTMPLLHTWSLAVEEQYYMLWPLIMALAWRFWRKQAVDRRERKLLLLFASVFAFSLVANFYWSEQRVEWAFYLMPMRAWELMSGGLIALLQARCTLTPRQGGLLAAAGLAAILGAVFGFDATTVFPGFAAMLPTFGTVAMIVGLRHAGATSPVTWLMTTRPMVQVGQLSYSWYLWHWPVLALTRTYYLAEKDLWRDMLAVGIAYVLAWLTHRLIENPIRYQRPWVFATTRGTLWSGLAMSVIVLGLAVSAITVGKMGHRDRDAAWPGIVGPNDATDAKCFAEGIRQLSRPHADCTYGAAETSLKTVIWGDSHGAALAPAAEVIARNRGERVLLRAMPGCIPVPGLIPLREQSRGILECPDFNDAVMKEIMVLASEGVRNVIISSRWVSYMGDLPTDPGGGAHTGLLTRDQYGLDGRGQHWRAGQAPADPMGSLASFEPALLAAVGRLQAAGLNVILLAPVPELPFNAVHCLTRRSAEECVVPRSRIDARRQGVVAVLKRTAEAMPGVQLIDPIDAMCDEARCYTVRNALPLYRDDDHISIAMARNLAESLIPLMAR